MNKKERFCDVDNIVEWRHIITVLLAFVALAANATVPDSIRQNLADFDSVVYMAEHDYAPFKFKVTNKNKKEYNALKKRLIKDLTKGKRSWQDAVCAYVGWFGDYHFFPYGNNDIYTNYKKYRRKQLDYNTLMDEYRPKQMSCKIDDDTWLIRYPSCGIESKWMEQSVREYLASRCPCLIIDIRGNGGGQDDNYMPLMQLLYDNPDNKRDGSIMRYTAASIRRCEWTEEDLIDLGYPTDIAHAPEYVVKMEDGTSLLFDSISSLPKKAAIIIDNGNFSSGEQLILDARSASRRTRIYGRDNTAGCIDTGNCISYIPTNRRIAIQYPTTYSTRYEKGTCVDPTGIAPDVRITLPYPKRLTDNIDEWVLWVAEDLKR
jgi:hypothetical protein